MKRHCLYGCLMLAALGLSGCGAQIEDPGEPGVDTTIRLGESTDIDLNAWLGEPRSRLAELGRDAHDRLENSLKITRTETEHVLLLPNLRMPLTVPILRSAAYSAKLGISLPPYVKEGERDPLLALHLARYGDVEAALKLIDPGDAATVKQIEALRLPRNYPVEWSRLVGLTLLDAQLKMARSDIEGATELVLLHRQLRTILEGKAGMGPLGASLLPIGQRALKAAVVAWREGSHKLPVVADQVDEALKEWGAVPASQLALEPGATRAATAQLFREEEKGRLMAVKTRPAMLRVLDLGNFPVIDESLEAVLAWFDAKDHLKEVWWIYRSQIGQLFPEPINLAHLLVDSGVHGNNVETSSGLPRQSFPARDLTYDVTMLPRASALGAWLRLADAKAGPLAAVFPSSPLNFGAVNLARSFETTRRELAPQQKPGKQFTIQDKDVLARIKVPVGDIVPSSAVVDKAGDQNLIASLKVVWPPEDNPLAFAKLLWPLWETYGPCRFESVDNALQATWQDSWLRVDLKLPYNHGDDSPELVVRDERGTKDVAERLKEALAPDQEARKERWAEKKPLSRLPRFMQWPGLELGRTRDEVIKALPRDVKLRSPVKAADGSFSILVAGEPAATALQAPQQLVLRFGADDKLAEVRVLYEQRAVKPVAGQVPLLDILKKAGGEPEAVPAPWAAAWADQILGKNNTPVCLRWADDRTVMTYQRDALGIEVVLTAWPAQQVNAPALAPLEVCSRGVDACQLGDSREAVVKRWKIDRPRLSADGGLLLFPSTKSPYDLVVVYFEDNKVARVLARHRAEVSGGEDCTADLQKAWSTDADRLGVVRRLLQVPRAESDGLATTGYGWNDQRTRVFTFVAKDGAARHLFTEWRGLPLPVARAATAKP